MKCVMRLSGGRGALRFATRGTKSPPGSARAPGLAPMRIDTWEEPRWNSGDAVAAHLGELEEAVNPRAMRTERREAREHLGVAARDAGERHRRHEGGARVADETRVCVAEG